MRKKKININQRVSYLEPHSLKNISGEVIGIMKILESKDVELVGKKICCVSEGAQYIPKFIFESELTVIE